MPLQNGLHLKLVHVLSHLVLIKILQDGKTLFKKEKQKGSYHELLVPSREPHPDLGMLVP